MKNLIYAFGIFYSLLLSAEPSPSNNTNAAASKQKQTADQIVKVKAETNKTSETIAFKKAHMEDGKKTDTAQTANSQDTKTDTKKAPSESNKDTKTDAGKTPAESEKETAKTDTEKTVPAVDKPAKEEKTTTELRKNEAIKSSNTKTNPSQLDQPPEKKKPLRPEAKTPTKSGFGAVVEAIDTSVEVGLEYPLSFGAHGKFHITDSFYARLGTGFTPKILVGAFKRLAPTLGYLNRHEATLMGDTIKNSLFGSTRLGWLPYTKKAGGPYMEVGLLYLAWGLGETTGTALNEAIGTDLNTAGDNIYSVKSDVLAGTFHIGYQIPIESHIHLNLELGILKILFVDMKKHEKEGVPSLPKEYHADFKKLLVGKKGWIFPTLSAWLGFSF